MDFASEYSCQKAYSSIRNTINLNISAQNSKKIYTDVADGVVSDVFFASPNQAGDWVRMCEVLYHVDGKEYTIREQCWTQTSVGEKCKVKYNPKRPRNAYVDW